MSLAVLDARAERAFDWWRVLRTGLTDMRAAAVAWRLSYGSWSDDGLGWAGRCAKAAPIAKRRRISAKRTR